MDHVSHGQFGFPVVHGCLDKTLVQLDRAKGNADYRCNIGITGPKIIQPHPDSMFLHLYGKIRHHLRILRQGAFRKLNLHSTHGRPIAFYDVQHLLRQIRL